MCDTLVDVDASRGGIRRTLRPPLSEVEEQREVRRILAAWDGALAAAVP